MRKTRLLLGITSLLFSGTLITACSGGGGGGSGLSSIPQSSQKQSESTDQLTPSLGNGNGSVDWPYYNNDLQGQRFASLSQITPENASGVHKVCSFTVPQESNPEGFNFESGPIVVHGIMYFSTINNTYAINASNCTQIWDASRPASGSGLTNRGVAYSNGTIFRGTIDGNVVAINALTGKILWDRHIANAPETFTSAPITWGRVLFIGTSGAESGAQCHVYAIDQKSGSVIWSYQTVPSDSSSPIPNWTDTTGDTPTHPAGGSTWSTYTLDPQTGTLLVSVGNPGPDFDDRDRGGADLNTDSVIALNAFTGKLLAGYQLVPHDTHDWDTAAAPVVADGFGGTRILAGSKDGYVYSINPLSGKFAWHTPITTVDAMPATPIPGTPVSFCPGTTGGVEWNGPSFSAPLGMVYSNGVDICVAQLTEETTFSPFSSAPQCGGVWVGATPCYSFGTSSSSKSGWITAMNESSGSILWQYHSPTPMIAGVTSTASGLLITGDLNGNILFFDGRSGSILESYATNEPIGGGVITYAVSGKQYVAAAAGIASPLIWTPGAPAGPSSVVVLGL